MKDKNPNLFTVGVDAGDESVLEAVERALAAPVSPLEELPTLTNVALGDPYLAEQLASLHRQWEVRPRPASGLVARLRARVAWWLLGAEIEQVNATHATLVRLVDSLIVQLDEERSARRRIEEGLAGRMKDEG